MWTKRNLTTLCGVYAAPVVVVVVIVVASVVVVVDDVLLLLVRMFGVKRTCLVTTGNVKTIVCRLNADFFCFGNSLLDQETKILHRRDG